MKKIISFTVFVAIILMMAALNAAQAQSAITVGFGYRAQIPVYVYGPRAYRVHRMLRPVPVISARHRFVRRTRFGAGFW